MPMVHFYRTLEKNGCVIIDGKSIFSLGKGAISYKNCNKNVTSTAPISNIWFY